MNLLFAAIALYSLAGSSSLVLKRFRTASLIHALGTAAGAALGLYGAAQVLAGGASSVVPIAREVVFGGTLEVGLDPLSAFFLVPIFALSAVGAAYARGYLAPHEGRRRLGPVQLAYNLLAVSLVLVVLARDALVFLFAWELMTLCAYVLVTFEHEESAARRAGYIYLIAS